MGERSKIEWTDHTFNPWTGCTKVSPGCDHCYAEGWAKRSGTVQWGDAPRRRTTEANWRLPVKWNEQAGREGRRFRVFCASLADVFDNQVPSAWRSDLFDMIESTPNLDWLLLTKRIGNVRPMVGTNCEELPNVWLGATVVNQEEADRDIPKLLATPARVRFLSCEPLLGPIDFRKVPGFNRVGLDLSSWWVIVGGESGPGARPMHPDWARSLRDQCAVAGVPFLFKQVGEAVPVETDVDTDHGHTVYPLDDSVVLPGDRYQLHTAPSGQYFVRVGKKAAGRLLDGRTHDEFPAANTEATKP